MPGTAARWRLSFHDTATGTKITSWSVATRQGPGITISLPDFTDDIALKMAALP